MDCIDYFKSLDQERQYDKFPCRQSNYSKEQQLYVSIDDEDSDTSSIDPQITIKILNNDLNFLPNGLYERLLICLHPLLDERLDYSNLTFGRTIDKSLLTIQRFEEQKQIHLISNNNILLEHIKNLLIHNLFSLYPNVNLRIETLF